MTPLPIFLFFCKQAYGLAGRWEDALSLLPRAAAVAGDSEEVEEARGAFLPDERMYCSIINAMGESGAWKQAVELVQSMRRPSSSSSSAQDLAGGDGNTDHKNATVAAAVSALVDTPTPIPRPGQAAYACACRACARQGEWDAVQRLMESMREDGVSRNVAVYASAMRAFIEAGEWERAVEIVTAEVSGESDYGRSAAGGTFDRLREVHLIFFVGRPICS